MKKKYSILIAMACFVCSLGIILGCVLTKNSKSYCSTISEDFIQGWLCEKWIEEEWICHIDKLKKAGYNTIILQSSMEVKDNEITCTYFYDESIKCQQYNTIERLMSACEKTNFKARIGLVDDRSWWGKLNDQLVKKWIKNNTLATIGIYNIIKERYLDYFAGFYFSYELYTQDLGYEKYWANIISAEVEVIESLNPKVSLLFSPCYSTYYKISEHAEQKMWETFFKNANLRAIDIFAPQDGYGGGDVNPTREYSKKVNSHLKASSSACEKYSNALFYVNIEFYTDKKDIYASDKRIEYQKKLANRYNAKGLISFSYSHYFLN